MDDFLKDDAERVFNRMKLNFSDNWHLEMSDQELIKSGFAEWGRQLVAETIKRIMREMGKAS